MFARVVSSFQSIGARIYSRRKAIGIFLALVLVSLVVTAVVARPALAADAAPGFFTTDYWILLLARIILAIAGFFIKITVFILTFVITLAGYNGYLDSTAVNVGWVMIRDVTNMGFVVILLVIAFGTILGLEQYEWKHLLGKFVFAAILVNFSRTICGVVIDLAQVIMTTFVNGIAATAGGNLINAFQLNKILELSDGVTPQVSGSAIAQFIAAVGGVTFAAMVMAVMLVFLYMLVGRVISLWILIVLSPFAFVLSILPSTEEYASQWRSKFISEVITGPVLVFFVWLSFVTLGGGNIASDIASPDHNALSTNRLEGDAGTNGIGSAEQTAGISAILSWTKMASFAIAIGMLLAGAKAAQELGGFGAGALEGATEFGMKAFNYASGIAAARWTGEKGYEAGASGVKWAAMHAPLVGGQRWIDRYNSIKGRAGIAIGNFDLARNKKAKDWEEKAEKEGGVWNKIKATAGAAIIESGGRKTKRAEDWLKAAENKHTEVEESYGTSKSASGKAKLRTGVLAEIAEHLAEAKKAEKYAKEKEKLLDLSKEKGHTKDHKDAHRFHEQEDSAVTSQANAEEIKKRLDRAEELSVAKKRDEILQKNNQTPRYVEQVLAKHTKDDIELAGSSDYDRTMAKVGYLRDRIRAQRSKMGKMGAKDPAREKEQKILNSLIKDMASLQAFNGSQGALFAAPGTDTALQGKDENGNNLKHDVVGRDVAAIQANELSSILQRRVEKDQIGAAIAELKDTLGQSFTSVMRSYTAGLAHASEDGAVAKGGLFREKFDPDKGSSEFIAADVGDAEGKRPGPDKSWSEGKIAWAASESKATKIHGFSGSIDSVNGQMKIVSDAAQDLIANIFGSITKNVINQVHEFNINDFNESFKNMSKAEIEPLLRKMMDKAESMDGLNALFKRMDTKKLAAKLGVSQFTHGSDKNGNPKILLLN